MNKQIASAACNETIIGPTEHDTVGLLPIVSINNHASSCCALPGSANRRGSNGRVSERAFGMLEDCSPLLHAARTGNSVLCRQLLEHGADPDVTDFNGICPLIYAALNEGHKGGLEMCIDLLSHSANPNAICPSGLSAVQIAIYRWDLKLLTALIAAGADLNRQDNQGDSILHSFASLNSPCSSNSVLGFVCAETEDHESLQVLELLLSCGADPNIKNSNGETPLHLFASAGSVQACSILLDKGARLDSRNHKGQGPIDMCPDTKTREFLLRRLSLSETVAFEAVIMTSSANRNRRPKRL